MAQVNTNVWGTEEHWIDITNNYPSTTDVKERTQWASYDGEHTKNYDFLQGNYISANQQINNSLSWCGLGEHSPYNRLTYYRGVEAYSYRFDENSIPWTTFNENCQESIITQESSVTNFAVAVSNLGGNVGYPRKICSLDRTNTQYDRFHMCWGPDSIIDTLHPDTSEHHYTTAYDFNRTLHQTYLARIPVKNIVAVPRIIAINSVNTTNPSYIMTDLKTYLDPEENNSYVNYPYVVSGQMALYTDVNGATGVSGHHRTESVGINSIALIKDLTMFNNIPGNYTLDATSRYLPNPSEQLFEGTCINYGFIYGTNLPIYGLLTGATPSSDFGNCRYDSADVPYEDGSSWNWMDINYYHFELNISAPTVYTWAGEDPTVYVYNSTDRDNCRRYIYKEVTAQNADDFRETIRQAIACFGLFFVDGDEDKNLNLDAEDMMLGILEDGIGNGKYSHGEENRDQDQWNWDDMHDNPYDPTVEPDLPDEGIIDTKNKSVLPDRGLWQPYCGSYITNAAGLYDIIDASTNFYVEMLNAIEDYNNATLDWTFANPLDFESYLQRQWGGKTNPIECLTSVVHYPFNIKTVGGINTSGQSRVQVGSWYPDHDIIHTGSLCDKVGLATNYGVINCGSIAFPINKINDFRSYEPYTTATLYIPFCGSVQLECSVYVGHMVQLKYIVDWRTGMCLALVYKDSLIMEAVPGTMGNRINLSMEDTATYTGQLANAAIQEQGLHKQRFNNFLGTVGNLVKIAGGVALTVGSEGALSSVGLSMAISGTKGLIGNAQAASMREVAENQVMYDVTTAQVPTRQISTATASVNACNEMVPRIVVIESEVESSTDYAHTVGHACLKYGTLSNISSGYTVCQSIDTNGINATQTEKEMIRNLVLGGVYV